jgi:hypothetical protein
MRTFIGRWTAAAVIVIAALLAASTTSSSQEKAFATRGVVEAAGTVSFSSYTPVFNGETDDAISVFTFAPQVGYFFADGFEVSLGTGISLFPGITSISPSEGDGLTVMQLFAAPSYNFTTSGGTAFPFVEAHIGYTSASIADEDVSGFSYGGRGGVKIVIADHLLLNLSGEYLLLTFNPEGADERNGFNYLSFRVGISGYF